MSFTQGAPAPCLRPNLSWKPYLISQNLHIQIFARCPGVTAFRHVLFDIWRWHFQAWPLWWYQTFSWIDSYHFCPAAHSHPYPWPFDSFSSDSSCCILDSIIYCYIFVSEVVPATELESPTTFCDFVRPGSSFLAALTTQCPSLVWSDISTFTMEMYCGFVTLAETG